MKLYNINNIGLEVQIDENYNDSKWSQGVDDAIEYGFDENFPIVVDEDGLIIDGNHRFVAFTNEGRQDELVFAKVVYNDFLALQSNLIDTDELDLFNKDDEFFYAKIAEIAQN